MYTVMIVDDYEVFRRDLRHMTIWGDASGFVITEEAANGRDALQKLRKNPVDLLLTDIRMPIIDGLELIGKTTEQDLCACILIMSQFSDFEYARKGLSSGALDYLLKPVNQEELSKALARAAVYIAEKRLSASRMNYLEKVLSDSAGDYFPDTELDQLMLNIGTGSSDALNSASYLVDVTFSEYNFDTIKTAQAMNRVLKKLIELVSEEFPWISKFHNLQNLKLNDFSELSEISQIKEAFTGKVGAIISIIRKFELDIDNDGIVRMACRTILENIDSEMTINEVSGILFITRTYLSQIFKEKTGMTLVKYLTDVKIERAKALITSGSKNYEIAEKLGYKDDEYFKKLFKKSTGMTINEYKNLNAG